MQSRKLRDIWSNRQVWPWSTKSSREKANRVLPREQTGHGKNPFSTTQGTTLHMDITRWLIPKSGWLYLCSQKWKSSIQSAKTRLGADCGSNHELLIAKFRLKLKKVGKTTRPFRYDLNQIPYNYIVEVTSRFKGLDLIECLKNYGQKFITLYRKDSESESCSVISDSLWPYGLYSSWNSPGQNTGMGSLSLLQGTFPTQGSNPGLPHYRQILYQLSHEGSPHFTYKWAVMEDQGLRLSSSSFLCLSKRGKGKEHILTEWTSPEWTPPLWCEATWKYK